MIHVNGLNGAGGGYLLPPLPPAVVATLARGEQLDAEERRALTARYATAGSHLGVVDADPDDLAQAGWGVIFAEGADPAIRQALAPLLEHRRGQAAAEREGRYRVFGGADGYRPGESAADFLVRHRVAPGQPANPDRMPYYLLLVGDPETIPFRFQYMLDVVYAVGRLHFDTPEEYERYAHSVVANERRAGRPRAVFFGARNPDDRATALSADHLVAPLAADASRRLPPGSVQAVVGQPATKARLSGLLGGPDTPDLVFVAGHGMGFPNGHPRQLPHQGALLCQDWPGPLGWRGPIPETFYFAADDLGAEAGVSGLVAFLFACFGAGTPRTDDFARQALGAPAAIAPHAFVGRLPRRLLGHPCGGALAVIGHVERTWGFSFMWPGIGEQVDGYREALRRLLGGAPVGWAVEALNDRFAALSLWKTGRWARLGRPLEAHHGEVTAVAFSRDGQTLASAGEDRTVRLWGVADPTAPVPFGRLTGHPSQVNAVAFSRDGRTLASADDDGTIRLWDPTSRASLGQPLTGHQEGVNALAFSPDGGALASGGEEGTVIVWNVTDPAHPARLGRPLGHPGPVAAVAFGPDGDILAVGGDDRTVALWDVTDRAHPARLGPPLTDPTEAVTALAFSPDGHTLVAGVDDGSAVRWDLTRLYALRDTAVARACSLAGGELDPEEWSRYVSDLPYEPTCPKRP